MAEQPNGFRRRRAMTVGRQLVDRLSLVMVAVGVSAVIGGLFYLLNRREVLGGSESTATILVLIAICIHSRLRIRQLEKILKGHGIEARIFPEDPNSPPR